MFELSLKFRQPYNHLNSDEDNVLVIVGCVCELFKFCRQNEYHGWNSFDLLDTSSYSYAYACL